MSIPNSQDPVSNKVFPLMSLPPEMQMHIFSFLPIETLADMTHVCKDCSAVSKEVFNTRLNEPQAHLPDEIITLLGGLANIKALPKVKWNSSPNTSESTPHNAIALIVGSNTSAKEGVGIKIDYAKPADKPKEWGTDYFRYVNKMPGKKIKSLDADIERFASVLKKQDLAEHKPATNSK